MQLFFIDTHLNSDWAKAIIVTFVLKRNEPLSEFYIINRIKKTMQIEFQIAKSSNKYLHTLKNGIEL